ncbi:expressed unknown protein [Seminavis robusta]|uniref:Uncharacterized protein n=1 Tax=Seminavis robusta TaxID=568900 RepID=A0A9N8ELI7_9STRA|nr:expressed unknown protein [Seminavis robusta]|eukprot:Sro1402_g269550.1 n/a (268) ;mRNA; r:10892-11695
MKFLAPVFLCLLALTPNRTIASDELKECDATYSVQLGATYPNDVAVQCTPEDMSLITQVIQSVVEIDTYASRLSKYVPAFHLVSEQYRNDITIDHTGALTTRLGAEEIVEHLTEEDIKEDIYYENGADDEGNGRRRLRKLINDALEHGSSAVDDRTKREGDQAHRQAQQMNCKNMGGCTAEWCCQFCGTCWGGGRRQQESHPLLRGMPEVEEEGTAEEDEELVQRIKQHEERVSNEIEKKMRYMARKEAVPCLGNFWQVEVQFKLIL